MRRGSVILGLSLLGSGLFGPARIGGDIRQIFPLYPGTSWLYRGLVRSPQEGSTVGKVTAVTWKMSVVRTVEREGISVAIVNGFPADLDWSDGRATPTLSIIAETPDSKFFLDSEWDAQSVLDQIDNPKYPLRELARSDNWFLQLPLATGERFCVEEGAQRPDGYHCWTAGAPHPADLHSVKGAAVSAKTAYEVELATKSDRREFEFVDGVGIASYAYYHYGTIAETELHLAEFHPGSSSTP